jgi:hypothetical protein
VVDISNSNLKSGYFPWSGAGGETFI